MSAGKVILLALHIIFAGLLISQFFVDVVMSRSARKMKGQPGGQLLGMAQGQLLALMGQIGGIGVLLTGIGLISIDGYALFGINGFTPTWLFIKQVIYVIAIVIVAVFITRGTREMRAAAAAGNTAELPPRVQMASYLVNVLVLINIVLAVWKPM